MVEPLIEGITIISALIMVLNIYCLDQMNLQNLY